MNNKEILVEAIKRQLPISYEYNKEWKVKWLRMWNPHALFILKSKDGKLSTKLHLVQTDWVSDSKDEKPFPDFRMFNIEDLSNIIILEEKWKFDIFHKKYNPEWEWYKNIIQKV